MLLSENNSVIKRQNKILKNPTEFSKILLRFPNYTLVTNLTTTISPTQTQRQPSFLKSQSKKKLINLQWEPFSKQTWYLELDMLGNPLTTCRNGFILADSAQGEFLLSDLCSDFKSLKEYGCLKFPVKIHYYYYQKRKIKTFLLRGCPWLNLKSIKNLMEMFSISSWRYLLP